MTVANASDSQTPIRVPQYARASLPTAGTAGRLLLGTDEHKGLWADNGTQWWPVGGHVFNVKAFGAKGDGATDDLSAINSAITAANATRQDGTSGGTVYFPAGTYKVSGYVRLRSNVELLGESALGTKIDLNTTGARLSTQASSSDVAPATIDKVAIRNLTFENLVATTDDRMVEFGAGASVTGNTITNVLIEGCRFLQDSGNAANSIASVAFYGYSNAGRANTKNLTVRGCYIEFHHLGVIVKHGATRVTVAGNTFIHRGTNTGAEAVKVEYTRHAIVANNHIEMGDNAAGVTIVEAAYDVVVQGNTIDCSAVTAGTNKYAIRLSTGAEASNNVLVLGNVLRGSGTQKGIYLESTNGNEMIVAGNLLDGCSIVTATGNYLYILNNTIASVSTLTAIDCIGRYTVVAGNVVRTCTTGISAIYGDAQANGTLHIQGNSVIDFVTKGIIASKVNEIQIIGNVVHAVAGNTAATHGIHIATTSGGSVLANAVHMLAGNSPIGILVDSDASGVLCSGNHVKLASGTNVTISATGQSFYGPNETRALSGTTLVGTPPRFIGEEVLLDNSGTLSWWKSTGTGTGNWVQIG